MTEQTIRAAIERDGRPPTEVIQRLHELQTIDTASRLERLSRYFSSQFGSHSSPFTKRMVPSKSGDRKPPTGGPVPFNLPVWTCAAGYNQLGSASSGFYGRDEAPRFGPLDAPQPQDNSNPEFPFHIYSVQTHGALGELSVAVAAGNEAFGGYGVTNAAPNSGGNGTTSVSTGLATSFYLPGFDKRTSVLQAGVQLTADHPIVESIVPEMVYKLPNDAIQWVGVYGALDVTLVQGLGFLFGDYTRVTSSMPFVNYNTVNGETYITNTPIDTNGAMIQTVSAEYDGVSDIFFVNADVSVTCVVFSSDPKYACGIACDTRFASGPSDDVLRVYNDNAPYSCAYQVTQMKLCGA
jgi:hypothetical protein